MRILIVGVNLSDYLAKCHEAFRTGLRTMFGARCFGRGYPNFDPTLRRYPEIVRHCFPDGTEPDLILTDWDIPPGNKEATLPYDGIGDTPGLKAMVFGDYWQVTENFQEAFIKFIEPRVDLLLCYFPQAGSYFSGTSIASRFHTMFSSFDPTIFNDHHQTQQYDVGFLAAGSQSPDPFYPERHRIHQKLQAMSGLRYFSAPHPGWQRRQEHPLVGIGFSRAINSCRMFVTTGSHRRHLHAKYVEALASHTVLLADAPESAERFGLRDGHNYIQCNEHDIVDKVHYYLDRPELCNAIADAGYQLAISRHTCFHRAAELLDIVARARRQRQRYPSWPPAEPLRLHLGCGQDYWPGYINIDSDPASKADIVCDMREVSRYFAAQSVQEIAVIPALNYLRLWEAQQLFCDFARILRPAGRLIIETVDVEKAAEKVTLSAGNRFDDYLEGIRNFHAFGLDTIQRRESYLPNHMSWSRDHLTKELNVAGFKIVHIMEPQVHVPPPGVLRWRDMRVEAIR